MILVYCNELTPRIEYIFKVVFNQILQVEISFTGNTVEFVKSDLPKINYSLERFESEFYIKPHRLMHCKALITPTINSVWHNGEKYFCESSKDSVFPFDPLAASFYILSRHEEYTEKERDKLDRYPANKSILTRYNLLKKPIVNIWANMLIEKLKEFHPGIEIPTKKFQFVSTIDVDNAWAFLNKGFWRASAALLKSVGNKEFKERLDVIFGSKKDPYDTYDYLDSVFKGHEEKVKFFFLLGDYGRYDKNISHRNKNYKKLIKRTRDKYEVGIHPSLSASKKKGRKKVIKEKGRLEEITESTIEKSRQHFLRLKLPKTYRRLIKSGIKEDYTMGYPAQSGFRAGICTPYYWYDLKNETTTNLLIVPFQVMDGTLRHYLQLSPEKALEEIKLLMEEVKKVNGTFVSVWHNETVNNMGYWKGYQHVFEEMNKMGFKLANE